MYGEESFKESSESLDSQLASSWHELGDSSCSTVSLALGFPFAWVMRTRSINEMQERGNGSYCIYQRFHHIDEDNGSFGIVLTHKPRLHAVLHKRSFDRRLNCNKSH